ncbi:MAG: gamma carbonic anhydrase family protein [Rhodospirillaceae bacterium]|jgi:carbonic anhydrase/acetyltransferase-like protein (isoleucine patch superfamily)|nr:gamma carbonic anhydrase family protein [Rhodospirillaceae bacterium]MBT5050926.1 gamma carbonic anhydrase family protein [Rhodospirillaceae bacterium]MBT5459730.1 gamma carbonic anhydrase family protein [Rhodospirillaceae bacterium]
MKYALGSKEPSTGEGVWIAPDSDVIGDVTLGNNVSIWWNSVLRGDNDPMVIGDNVNIQDGCVMHTDPGFPLTLADNVSVGHMCMLHGCTIGEGSLIGINSVILNGAKIGRNCLIGAKALVGEGKEIPDNSLVLGAPGRVIREVSDDQRDLMKRIVASYVARAERYRNELKPLE